MTNKLSDKDKKDWQNFLSKKEKFTDVENIIDFITAIRSFKNELSISPGSYVDISLSGINKKNKSFFTNNETVIKKLGRITNFIDKDKNKPSASLVIKGSVFKLYFEENVDLNVIKDFSNKFKYTLSLKYFSLLDFILVPIPL